MYIDKTKLELSSMEVTKTVDSLSRLKQTVLKELKKRSDIVIKKADKNNMSVVKCNLDYIKEGERQLNSEYYCRIANPNLKHLEELLQNESKGCT